MARKGRENVAETANLRRAVRAVFPLLFWLTAIFLNMQQVNYEVSQMSVWQQQFWKGCFKTFKGSPAGGVKMATDWEQDPWPCILLYIS